MLINDAFYITTPLDLYFFYFLMKIFSAGRHLPPQQPCLPGQANGSDDDDDDDDDNDDDDDDDDGNQVDGAQKQLVGSLGAIERMLGIITEKLQVAIILFTHKYP